MTKKASKSKSKTTSKMIAYQKLRAMSQTTLPPASINSKNRAAAAEMKSAKHLERFNSSFDISPSSTKPFATYLRVQPAPTGVKDKKEISDSIVGDVSESESDSLDTGSEEGSVEFIIDNTHEVKGKENSEEISDDEPSASSVATNVNGGGSNTNEEEPSELKRILAKLIKIKYPSGLFPSDRMGEAGGEKSGSKVSDGNGRVSSAEKDSYSQEGSDNDGGSAVGRHQSEPAESDSSVLSETNDHSSPPRSVSEGSVRSSIAENTQESSDFQMTEGPDTSSIEETVTTWGAKFALADYGRRSSGALMHAQTNDVVDGDGMVADDESGNDSDYEIDSIQGFQREILARTPSPSLSQTSESTRTLAATPAEASAPPATEKVPDWFPKNIKNIYKIDHHGGALTFKELNNLTRYRTLLEINRRRKWKRYIEAGQARWKLQKLMHKLRVRSTSEKFYAFRKKQYLQWKTEAVRRWKKLEKFQKGVLVLDEKINTNFLMERVIYQKKLD